jgi:hypothetical protein
MTDWREYDFFRSIDGLKVNDNSTECAIAYDYELARDCQPLCTRIATCPNVLGRAQAWTETMPYHSRWFTSLTPGVVPERPDLEPLIPTACLLAPWFPAPWLAGSLAERQTVVSALERAYAPVRPLMLRPYPLSDDTKRILAVTAENGRYMRAEIVFDRAANPASWLISSERPCLNPACYSRLPIKNGTSARFAHWNDSPAIGWGYSPCRIEMSRRLGSLICPMDSHEQN